MENGLKTEKADFNVLEKICLIDGVLKQSGATILNYLGGKLPIPVNRKHNDDENELSDECIEETASFIEQIADYLDVTPLQAALFCAFFSKCATHSETAEVEDIKEYFSISGLGLLCLDNDIYALIDKNIIELVFNRYHHHFGINNEIRNNILQNRKITKSRKKKDIGQYDFVLHISEMVDQRSDTYISTEDLFDIVDGFEEANIKMLFVEESRKLINNIKARTLFYKICDDFINTSPRRSDFNETLTSIYRFPHERFAVMNEFYSETHILQNADLVQLLPNTMISNSDIELTDKGKKMFLREDYNLFIDKKKNNLMYPDDIKAKQMFYEVSLKNQINALEKNLHEEQFIKLQKHLSEKALPTGITAMFYGVPGTGKTETALQLAKATGRSIMQVDISATKSCWFGESQKIIKKVFTSYKTLCKKEKLKPILLFNEADAVLSKRRDITSSIVSQTENAIQNIILEEMEKLEGILIATTNLIDNLDTAFERRFLYKICFTNPTVDAKQAIWKSKISWLTDEESRKLASSYNFSGGEIDNIVRKTIMEEFLNGNCPTLSFIEELCKREKFHGNQRTRIGFQAD